MPPNNKERFMDKSMFNFLIPMTAIVMGCGMGFFGWYLDYRKRKEMLTLLHQERMVAIERGIELPPLPEAFFSEKAAKPRSPHSDFGWGLFWLLGGLGLLVAVYFNETPSKSLYALIPVAIGLHYLIYYFTIGKKEAVAIEAERKTKALESDRRTAI